MDEESKRHLRRLYPGLTDEELEEVEETFMRYAGLINRMVGHRGCEREE